MDILDFWFEVNSRLNRKIGELEATREISGNFTYTIEEVLAMLKQIVGDEDASK